MTFSFEGASRGGGRHALWQDGERVFQRGWRLCDDGSRSAVLVVLPSAEHPSRSSVDRLTHEYGLKDQLDGAWAAQPIELVREGGRTILILEDSGGEPLDRLLGVPMEVGGFLRLAIGCAAALAKLHQRGLVHKDVKPANILVDDTTGEVRLTGFGIASRVTGERQSPYSPETIAGTLAYMAPEQTGRMNRSIDSRSDLYALGITFYQMLTGVLPFSAAEPMEWVHCHLARQPMTPAERRNEIPGAISAIVMKLLAKMAEDRYQTAAGLERDLGHARTEWEAQHRIDDFPLGEHDTPDRLLIPERLYGRQREVETLLASFDRVASGGAPELVLVSGYSGIGKSSVVHELQPVLVPPRGLFASGKFDQYKRDIPCSTLAQAFQGLIRPLLGKSEADLAPWRDALREALGPNAGLVVDLAPELKLIIGESPLVPELPPLEARRRFQSALRQFIGVFARPEHPLALFLDDLQWLDGATLNVVEDVLIRSDLRHLLLIGAYRDNEVTVAHPLMRSMEAMRATGRVLDIKLGPLTAEDVTELVADSLRCDAEQAARLARLVHAKTGGNPFFMIQFLHALAEEGLLIFDHDRARWSWDLRSIHAKRYTNIVAELLAGKLTQLPLETQRAVECLACLGNVADVAMLSIVLEIPEEEVHAALWEAVCQRLIDRLDGSYKFAHDRVQEAAYALVPEASRAEAHLRIGRLLLAHTPPQEREETIFDIVNHLNRGVALITSREEREQLAELNLIAGQRAKASAAYTSALTYLIAGATLLPEDIWEDRHDLKFALELNRAECEYAAGQLGPAEERLRALATHVATLVEQAAVACLRMDLYLSLGQFSRAIAVGLECLRDVGVEWSPHPSEEEVRREYDRIWSQLGTRAIEDLVELPILSDPVSRATLTVLAKLGIPAFTLDHNLHALVSCRAVNLSVERGNCDASCYAYVWLGALACARFGDYEAGYRFGRIGCELVDQRGWKHFQPATHFSFGSVVMPWARPVKAARDFLHRALEGAKNIGDLLHTCGTWPILTTNMLAAGDHLAEVEREAQRGLDIGLKVQFVLSVEAIGAQLGLVRTLRGSNRQFGCLDNDQFEESAAEHRLASNPGLQNVECWYWIRKLQARFFAGDYPAAVESSSRAQRLLRAMASAMAFEAAEYHFYGALSRAASCDSVTADERVQHLEVLASHHRQLEVWADNCSANFEDRAALVGAEIARIEGRSVDAMDLYERAIVSARTNGFIHNEALAYELAARFYAARSFEEIADLYLRNARRGYLRWGADGKVRQLDRQYPQLGHDEPATDSASMITAPLEHLDLATVLKVSQAVSGEMVIENLLDTMMRAAVEHAGAERALLVLLREAEQVIVAEATTRGDRVTVRLCDEPGRGALPESVVRYVLRTRENVILDDAMMANPFSTDSYLARANARSVFCLPLTTQAKLIGALYLENNLAPRVFAPARTAVLKLLASQAAISLENTRLYRNLAERESRIRRLVDANIIGIFIWELDGRILEANDAFLDMLGYDRADLAAGRLNSKDLTPPEWSERDDQLVPELEASGSLRPFEKEYRRKDGRRVPVLVGVAAFEKVEHQGVAFVIDLTERRRAEQRVLAEHRATRILAEAVTVEEAMPRILQALCECLGWDLGAWWRLDRDSGVLRCAELWRAPSIEVPEFEAVTRASVFTHGEGLPGHAWGSGAPVCIPDVSEEPTFLRLSVAAREGLRAAFGFPVLLGREVLGVIELDSRKIRRPDRELLDMMADLGSQIGQFIERRRAEQALRESERESRRIVNTIPGLVAMLAPDGHVQTVNDQLFEYCGQTLEAIRQWATNGIVHSDDLPQVAQVFQQGIASGEPYEVEGRIQRFDGAYRWFQIRGLPLRDTRGQVVRWYSLLTDIEDRKRAEVELRHAYDSFVDAQRLSKTGTFITDIVGDNHNWSEELYRIHEFEPGSKVTVQRFRELVHPDDLPEFEAKNALAMTGGDVKIAYRIVTPRGGVKHLRGIAHVIGQSDGRPLFIGAVQDVTESVVAEEALSSARSELAHVTRVTAMGELTASIAHEVKQPVAAAVTSAQTALRWLEAQPPELGEVRDALSRIVRAGKRAGDVVGRIRALVSKTPPRKDSVEINAAIREVVELTRGEAVKNRVSVRMELAEGLPPILGDRVQLQQVILNLILNGIEAMSAGGETSRELRIRTRRDDGGGVLVTVADSGPGLATGELEQVFAAFYTTKPGGLGLGLSICKSIIEAHDGRLWASPNEPRGAVFQFTLPFPAGSPRRG